MKAYFYYGPYVENWKNKDWILSIIKKKGTLDFTWLGPQPQPDGFCEIPAGQALYFYGGRRALLEALKETKTYRWQPDEPSRFHRVSSYLVVFHGEVKAQLKKKQIVVISCVTAADQVAQIRKAQDRDGNHGILVESVKLYRPQELERLLNNLIKLDGE